MFRIIAWRFRGGTITGNIYGGFGANTSGNEASSNQVTISGAANLAETGNIYGGYTIGGNANNNTVTIARDRDNLKVKNIYGGYAPYGSTSGNVVNLNVTGIEATEAKPQTQKIPARHADRWGL